VTRRSFVGQHPLERDAVLAQSLLQVAQEQHDHGGDLVAHDELDDFGTSLGRAIARQQRREAAPLGLVDPGGVLDHSHTPVKHMSSRRLTGCHANA